jgi:hypothetical protein
MKKSLFLILIVAISCFFRGYKDDNSFYLSLIETEDDCLPVGREDRKNLFIKYLQVLFWFLHPANQHKKSSRNKLSRIYTFLIS